MLVIKIYEKKCMNLKKNPISVMDFLTAAIITFSSFAC